MVLAPVAGSGFYPSVMPMVSKKDKILGMSHGKAANRLRKMVMFNLIRSLGLDNCFRCGLKIDFLEDLSLDHQSNWQSSKDPVAAFFDVDDIRFSHNSCNSSAANRPNKKYGNAKERYKANYFRNTKKWRQENRDTYNAQRRQRRLNKKGVVAESAF